MFARASPVDWTTTIRPMFWPCPLAWWTKRSANARRKLPAPNWRIVSGRVLMRLSVPRAGGLSSGRSRGVRLLAAVRRGADRYDDEVGRGEQHREHQGEAERPYVPDVLGNPIPDFLHHFERPGENVPTVQPHEPPQVDAEPAEDDGRPDRRPPFHDAPPGADDEVDEVQGDD